MSELEPTRSVPARVWIFAALGALALHAGGVALAVAHFSSEDPDDADGAPAIEIGLDVMARADSTFGATPEHFHVDLRLRVTADGRRLADRRWRERLPRLGA